jgi:hypothetical protein
VKTRRLERPFDNRFRRAFVKIARHVVGRARRYLDLAAALRIGSGFFTCGAGARPGWRRRKRPVEGITRRLSSAWSLGSALMGRVRIGLQGKSDSGGK